MAVYAVYAVYAVNGVEVYAVKYYAEVLCRSICS
jgi:hypothetical protein